jgi:hypothetical protein
VLQALKQLEFSVTYEFNWDFKIQPPTPHDPAQKRIMAKVKRGSHSHFSRIGPKSAWYLVTLSMVVYLLPDGREYLFSTPEKNMHDGPGRSPLMGLTKLSFKLNASPSH